MIVFRKRSSVRQLIPSKEIKCKFQVWIQASGYGLKGGVTDVTRSLVNPHHMVYFDNYFTWPSNSSFIFPWKNNDRYDLPRHAWNVYVRKSIRSNNTLDSVSFLCKTEHRLTTISNYLEVHTNPNRLDWQRSPFIVATQKSGFHPMFRDLVHLQESFPAATLAVPQDMIQYMWHKIVYSFNSCRATNGTHIETFKF